MNLLGFEIYKLPPMIPPARLRCMVGEYSNVFQYRAVAENFLKCLNDLGNLQPSDKVLDVGCGCGQMAMALTGYLNGGTYEGFDIVEEMVEWCKSNITPRHPNFHFRAVDVYSKFFNPRGHIAASKYKFPYPDKTFDFVFLKSVFTHMLPGDLENYLSEVARVMKVSGKCLITYFLLNGQPLGKSTLDFKYSHGFYRVLDKAKPEQAIAYDEEYIRTQYDKTELKIIEPLYLGSWCGRFMYLSYQDIVIAVRNSA